jgi:hypothetical protein
MTFIFAIPAALVVDYAEKNVLIKGTISIVIFTIIALAGYFILGRVFLAPHDSFLYNILSTILPLIISIIFVAFGIRAVLGLIYPFYPIMALLSNTTWLSQEACIIMASFLSWLSVTLGMVSK